MDSKALIEKYKQGQLTPEDQELLEQNIASGEIALESLQDFQSFQAVEMVVPEPSQKMSDDFYRHLAEKKKGQEWRRNLLNINLNFTSLFVKWAYSIGLVLIGLTAGWLLHSSGPQEDNKGKNQQLDHLTAQVNEMKEMMMLTLLEKESPSDRLKAVNLTDEINDPSGKVTDALLKTLNNDQNINVRLAALEALYPYAGDPGVRQGLIKSIAYQKSPIMQVALADMMATLQEKRSVGELKQILKNQNTPPEVKERIEQNIQVLI